MYMYVCIYIYIYIYINIYQVQGLMETVKQMDTALQRRSKLKANAGTTISDSDKISLQLLLDVRAYGRGIESLGTQFVLPSYAVRAYV
jgi:hypothetical protein